MTSSLVLGLNLGATVLDGLLAGGNVDRIIVQMPAWRRVGVRAWAEYSRNADLGNGLFLYPFEAIGGAILTSAAAIAFFLDPTAARMAALPVSLAVVFVVGGLLATIGAAPKMLSLRQVDDEAGLQAAFRGFDRWGFLRGILQVLAFWANLWVIVAILK